MMGQEHPGLCCLSFYLFWVCILGKHAFMAHHLMQFLAMAPRWT